MTAQADHEKPVLGGQDWARIPTGQLGEALPFVWGTENTPNVENPIVIKSSDGRRYVAPRCCCCCTANRRVELLGELPCAVVFGTQVLAARCNCVGGGVHVQFTRCPRGLMLCSIRVSLSMGPA